MTKVKICGISTDAALAQAVEAGADFVGFVHFTKSPRHVSLDEAAGLARSARELGNVRPVVLLVDPDDELVARVADEIAPDIIQLHGQEQPLRVAQIRRRAGLPLWKAVAVATTADVGSAEAYLKPDLADLVLYDAKPPPGATLPGGNGLAFDWTILEGVAQHHAFALAGGLTPDNVAAAIELTGAAIVDVSSGVEAAPGQKDALLIQRFIAAAKRVGQTASQQRKTESDGLKRTPATNSKPHEKDEQ